MKFFDFCTDVTAVGVTAVLGLFLAGGVASQSDDASPADALAAAVFADAPAIELSAASTPLRVEATVSAPTPLDLSELERSLDSLLSGGTAAASDDAPAGLTILPDDVRGGDALGGDFFAGEVNVPSERPDTQRPAPATRPLFDAPVRGTSDFMDGLFDDASELGDITPPPAARTGPVEVLTIPSF